MTTDSRAGWRKDPYGVERWWDGAKWHDARDKSKDIVVRPRVTSAPPASIPRQAMQPHPLPPEPYAQQYAPAPQYVVMVPLKEAGIAYVLAIFLGTMGIHRFYLGRVGSGIAMLALGFVSAPLMLVGIGFFTLFALGIWWIVDLFLVGGMVREENAKRMSMQGFRGY